MDVAADPPRGSNLPRPLTLSAEHVRRETSRAVLHAAACVLTVLAGLGVGAYAAADIVRQSYLQQHGVPARWARVTGEIDTRGGIADGNELHVRFGDQQGVEHRVDMNFTSMFVAAPRTMMERVWYDPENPDSIALNLAIEIAPYRWIAIALGVLVTLIVAAAVYALDVRPMRDRLRLIHAVGAEGQEIIVRRTHVDLPRDANGRPVDGPTRWHFAGRAPDGREVRGETTMPKGHTPRFADAEATVMVALWSPSVPGTALVLRDDCAPFTPGGVSGATPGFFPINALFPRIRESSEGE